MLDDDVEVRGSSSDERGDDDSLHAHV
jgi:hypothetical protein